MTQDAVFTLKLDSALRTAFMSETALEHRPASQVVRELMRRYVTERQEARAYEDYLRQKVAAGRADVAAGRVTPNAAVEAEAAAWRDRVSASLP
jgi:predicted transcriptional regulator